MGKNVEKIRNMLNGIIDPSTRRVQVAQPQVPGEKEKNAKLEDRKNRKEKLFEIFNLNLQRRF